MTPLARRLAERLAKTGPITVAEFMTIVLGDPEHGYYRRADPLGAGGDFTTAPEISQLFGELIGAWLIDCWDRLGRPNPVRLVELGPGRGTLMADALRVARLAPEFLGAIRLELVEINPALRTLQAERLSLPGQHAAFGPRWHETLDAVGEGPMLLVANEFFDALPIRQLVFADHAWRERLVGWHADAGFHFTRSEAPSKLSALLPEGLRDAADEGSIVELSPAAIGAAAEIGRRVAMGGAALLIDYGRTELTAGETLQAVLRHRKVGLFDDPGAADLSSHVDFSALARAGREAGGAIFGPVAQGAFLTALGIEARAERLRRGGDAARSASIDSAVARLVGTDAMGTLFKVLSIADPALVPAGFPAAQPVL